MTTNILRISKEELKYHAQAFLENCSLTGKFSRITNPTSVDIPEYTTSETYSYVGSTPVDVPIHLNQDIPKKKLESLGWIKEGESSKPVVAFIPMYRYDYPNDDEGSLFRKRVEVEFSVREGAIVDLVGYLTDPLSESVGSEFTVESVEFRDDMHYYMCKLAPRREVVDGLSEEDQPQSGSKYLIQSDDHL